MKRTVRFKWLAKKQYWQVLVYKDEGVGLQLPPYQIHIIGDIHGKYKAYCNCKAKWHHPEKECVHEEEFYKYMLKLMN